MANPQLAAGHHRTRSFAYVVSGTVDACAVTPVDTVSHSRSPLVIGGGAQSIVVTPNVSAFTEGYTVTRPATDANVLPAAPNGTHHV
jgi:hypothetical protein